MRTLQLTWILDARRWLLGGIAQVVRGYKEMESWMDGGYQAVVIQLDDESHTNTTEH